MAPRIDVTTALHQITQDCEADFRECYDSLDDDPDQIVLDRSDGWDEPMQALRGRKVPGLHVKPGWKIRHDGDGALWRVVYAFRVNDPSSGPDDPSAPWSVCLYPIDELTDEPNVFGLKRHVNERFYTGADARRYFGELRSYYDEKLLKEIPVAELLHQCEIVSEETP